MPEKIFVYALQTAARLRVQSSHVLMVLMMIATEMLTAVIVTVVPIRPVAVPVLRLMKKKKGRAVQTESIMTAMV